MFRKFVNNPFDKINCQDFWSDLQRKGLFQSIFFQLNQETGASLHNMIVPKLYLVPSSQIYGGNNMQEQLIEKTRVERKTKLLLFCLLTEGNIIFLSSIDINHKTIVINIMNYIEWHLHYQIAWLINISIVAASTTFFTSANLDFWQVYHPNISTRTEARMNWMMLVGERKGGCL